MEKLKIFLKITFTLLMELTDAIFLLWLTSFIFLYVSYPQMVFLKLLLFSGLFSVGLVLFIIVLGVILIK